MSSRKDFIAAAAALANARVLVADFPVETVVVVDEVRKNIAHDLARYFAATCPRFDRERFFTACKLS